MLRKSSSSTRAAVAVALAVILISAMCTLLVVSLANAADVTDVPVINKVPTPVLNLTVTQETIATTICIPNYTKSIRPKVSYTNKIKLHLLAEQGLPVSRMGNFELDHRMPLSLGGHPSSPDNLWLQPWSGAANARQKDVIETRLHRLVCARKMTLKEAQDCISTDWQACELKTRK